MGSDKMYWCTTNQKIITYGDFVYKYRNKTYRNYQAFYIIWLYKAAFLLNSYDYDRYIHHIVMKQLMENSSKQDMRKHAKCLRDYFSFIEKKKENIIKSDLDIIVWDPFFDRMPKKFIVYSYLFDIEQINNFSCFRTKVIMFIKFHWIKNALYSNMINNYEEQILFEKISFEIFHLCLVNDEIIDVCPGVFEFIINTFEDTYSLLEKILELDNTSSYTNQHIFGILFLILERKKKRTRFFL